MTQVTKNTPAGSTVFGMFPVKTVTVVNGRLIEKQRNLVDHHCVLLGVDGSKALVAYAGTDADEANKRRPGYISFPRDVVSAEKAGWKFGSEYYVDCDVLAWVPVQALQVRGRLSNALFNAVSMRVMKRRAQPVVYSELDDEVVTGARRAMKAAA
ncbi:MULTISPECIES: hypothetical protein [unclassified Variovorax]|uniref:hypothetical protein n=1 Tax=unclassified Variovorax TaxID=663243 RepID=UPI00076C0707|nr:MULTISPECIES: hypothetical protein [unclassified Variovorax]KWT95603.1 hypothetical protein APY03_2480 [Variovorax sp. WDL1]PNG50214.1 hypothetical protein CHC06_05837 [Variovorax sp. B2]PNG51087.1 hypothetical protein CHC07_05743 [Variovorax sp. B4]VTU42368.1 hypothetical protein SRS16P1_00252 [Variovorax sp. SRS16]VTU42393.1 hypothetical protein E5P1_00250 [Variovorax sp. PBL-E5]